MEVYLIRHAEANPSISPDPYSVPLTEVGRAQAEQIAQDCAIRDIQFLCTSPMRSAQETADAVMRRLPNIERWDIRELEDMTTDDLLGEPMVSPLVSAWTAEQIRLGRERAWVRVTAALSRILLYAQANGLERIAIISHDVILNMLLLNWLELDWRALDYLSFRWEPASSTLVSLSDAKTHIVWLNRPTHVP
ncbi:MAG: histidine phosphatase family protein [Chloroflexi bacterium]|nr:histidine phosphatase family protein [Chloroflexota bacterium]